ncbi:MAG TPA: hypothetical protein VMI75_17270 [Polyangiaceae bacterium]|nr:hypothetical protein [Polyangiaceae bacterium]
MKIDRVVLLDEMQLFTDRTLSQVRVGLDRVRSIEIDASLGLVLVGCDDGRTFGLPIARIKRVEFARALEAVSIPGVAKAK